MGRYPGIYYHSRDQVWFAQITLDGKTIHLGSYEDELTALKVRDLGLRAFCPERKFYFLDEELIDEDRLLFENALKRKQGVPIRRTKRLIRPRMSKLMKKMLEAQELASNVI